MINLERLEGKDIYTFSIIGDIDQEGVEKFYKLLTIKSEEHKELKVLGIINHFPSFESFKAFSKTISMKF